MATTSPPPDSPSSLIFSSPNYSTSQSSLGVFTPSNRPSLRFARHYYDDDDDDESDEDLENIDPRAGPLTPRAKSSRGSPIVTPSKFIVKGTVTPSKAAPLFARFTSIRRLATRPVIDEDESFDVEESRGENPFSAPQSSVKQLSRGLRSHTRSIPEPRHATFLSRNHSLSELPDMPVPISNSFRHCGATGDVASYLLAAKSNSLTHLPWAASARGAYGGSSGRGVLGVSRMLGAGVGYTNVSHRPYHMTFGTESIRGLDMFTLPSLQEHIGIAHPLCADYATSSRSLNNYQAQWLAVGDNEGSLHLINTLNDCMASVDTSTENKPNWSTCKGSIFEIKWRFDDEMIATGGSDYTVKVWSPETGKLIQAFKGHRGSPRTIAWDTDGAGNILVSGGRDGGIHLYDLRVKEGSKDGETWSPCMSLWDAHSIEEKPRPFRGPGSRGGTRGSIAQQRQPKGVTSIAYLPGRGSKLLASAGCADAKVKLWDLRYIDCEGQTIGCRNVSAVKQRRAKDDDTTLIDPIDQGIDVSKQPSTNKSSHGISHMVVGADKIFAACTDGRIYTINCADFSKSSSTATGFPIPPLYHDVQRGNTLYARMALHDDDRTLALGCNTGVVTIWDTHAASLALGEVISDSINYVGNGEPEENWLDPVCAMARPTILRGGHSANFEVNCVSWAHGPRGPTLASVSDDYTIRTWRSFPREEAVRDNIY